MIESRQVCRECGIERRDDCARPDGKCYFCWADNWGKQIRCDKGQPWFDVLTDEAIRQAIYTTEGDRYTTHDRRYTMHDRYSDNSDHHACVECGCCITCGDCRCKVSKADQIDHLWDVIDSLRAEISALTSRVDELRHENDQIINLLNNIPSNDNS